VGRVVAAAAVAFALAACGGTAARQTPSPLPSGPLGVVAPDAVARAMTALCDIERSAGIDARATFYDRAHQTLHVIAAATGRVDRGAEAALLVAKQRVEAELEREPPDPETFADDVAVLYVATSDALRAIGLDAPACPRD
jgi:hypothetical protein